jgi:hypothetical protein
MNMLRKYLALTLLSACTLTASAQMNTLTKAEQKDGWKLLFDGKSLNGWHSYNHATDASAWKAVDGELMLDPSHMDGWQVKGGGDLVTDEEYENYHLSLEWKVSDSANSGIIFNIKEDPKYKNSWYTGLEMQVLDDNGHPDRQYVSHRAGCLYDLIPVSKSTVKPAGQWNKAEIVLNKGDLKLYLNGVNVVSTTLWNDDWKKLVAGSKFKDMPAFATYKIGRLGLQDHGNKVWFRNIKIQKL